MHELEQELGIRVLVSTAVAMGSKCQIAIEREIAQMRDDIDQIDGPRSDEIREQFVARVTEIRERMNGFAEEIAQFAIGLKKEISRGSSRGKTAKKRGNKGKTGAKNRLAANQPTKSSSQ